MLAGSRDAITQRLGPDALVLDVGGGASPLARADWVLDLMPWAQRGLYGPGVDPAAERFREETWLCLDICDRRPWPFADGQFDFSVCSHTLEDIRDPIWVCSELNRVSRAGYIEVPSRLEEQSYGFQGPWAGWGHHRWLIDPVEGSDGPGLEFVAKHHVLHNRAGQHFPAGFQERLTPEQRVLAFWWQGSFGAAERVFTDGPSLDAYLEGFVTSHGGAADGSGGPSVRAKTGLAKDLLKRLKSSLGSADSAG